MQIERNNEDQIKVFKRKNYVWQAKYIFLSSEEINKYLLKNFVQINLNTIVNIYCIDTSLSNLNKEYVVVDGMMYIISAAYMPHFKSVLEAKAQSVFNSIAAQSKASYLNTVLNKTDIKIDKIKYLFRKKTQTVIINNDGTKHYYYDTLKTFDKSLLKGNSFVRIRRDCIVNTNYLTGYSVDAKTKTGEVCIDSDILHISRRNLPTFRKVIKNMPQKLPKLSL